MISLPKILDHAHTAKKSYKGIQIIITITFAVAYYLLASDLFGSTHFMTLIMPVVIASISFNSFGIFLSEYRYDQAKKNYKQRLFEFDASLLMPLASSPEMTTDERYLITQHLNENHPGWSLRSASEIQIA